MKRSLAGLLAVLVLLIYALPAAAAGEPVATVTASALNVRRGPGTNYTVMSALHAGDQVAVTGRDASGGWYQVRLGSGQAGWISAAYAQLAGDASALPAAAAPQAPATQAPAAAAAGRGKGVIVFQTSSGGAIYAVNPDGTGLRYLTTGIDPVLSPDGRQVAFTRWDSSSPGAQGSLYVVNADGSGERVLLTDLHQPKSPAWSPDGKQVVINIQQGGTTQDQILNTCVPHKKGDDVPPGFTEVPGGKMCLYKPADPHWGLRLVNLADGTWRDLPRDLHSFTPAWDPTKAWHIVFRGDHGLQSLDINQNTNWPLSNEVAARSPVFSPDGSKIVTTFKQNDHWEIHVMNADGSGDVRLTETSPTAPGATCPATCTRSRRTGTRHRPGTSFSAGITACRAWTSTRTRTGR